MKIFFRTIQSLYINIYLYIYISIFTYTYPHTLYMYLYAHIFSLRSGIVNQRILRKDGLFNAISIMTVAEMWVSIDLYNYIHNYKLHVIHLLINNTLQIDLQLVRTQPQHSLREKTHLLWKVWFKCGTMKQIILIETVFSHIRKYPSNIKYFDM